MPILESPTGLLTAPLMGASGPIIQLGGRPYFLPKIVLEASNG
ncbi:MAG: hypothetical protein QW638_01315 [Candidatus Bathyarchaeia archaeon]